MTWIKFVKEQTNSHYISHFVCLLAIKATSNHLIKTTRYYFNFKMLSMAGVPEVKMTLSSSLEYGLIWEIRLKVSVIIQYLSLNVSFGHQKT